MKKVIKSKLFLSSLTVLVFLIGLSQTISYPEYNKVLSFKLHTIQNGVVKGNVLLDLHNENWFSYSGRDLSAKIYYRDRQIASGINPDQFRLERKSNSTIPMQVEFFMDSLVNELNTFLLQDSIELDIQVSGRFSFLRIPMSKALKVKIPAADLVNDLVSSLMQDGGIRITQVKLKEFTPKYSIFNVGFELKNNLPIELEMERISIAVYGEKVTGDRLASCVFELNDTLEAAQTTEIVGDIQVDNFKSAIAGITKILNGSLTYFIAGKAAVKLEGRKIMVPIQQSFKMDIGSRQITIDDSHE